MRPDRIIVGEVRGGEALDMLQAMNTGHEGSLATVHANNAYDALSRIETLATMSDIEVPFAAIRDQVNSAIDLVVQLNRHADGSRRIVELAYLTSARREDYQLSTLAAFDPSTRRFERFAVPPGLVRALRVGGEDLPAGWELEAA
jgi:pilus assembly protein CpaF